VTSLPAGERREALILSPHGHVEHHLVLVDDGSATWMHVEPGTVPSLIAYLRSMVFWSKVTVDDVSAEWAVLSPVAAGGVPLPEELVRRESLASEARPLAGHLAWEALRVAAGRPRLGFETDHRTIPHEVGWIGTAVHLDKGCYRGQETVARVHNLGRPPRRLVLLHLDGTLEELPGPGGPISLANADASERPVGFLGTAVHHAELGPIALAVVKRQVPDDAQLVVEGMAAAIDPTVAAPAPR
jgi:folate-binding protein YgfZ